MTGLIERLRDDVRQLSRMVEQAKMAGPETGVRVKDPSLLLADLSEAANEIERLERELETANGLWTFWNEKAQETAGKLADARRYAFFVGWEMCETAGAEDTCADAWAFWSLMEDGRDDVEGTRRARAEETKG